MENIINNENIIELCNDDVQYSNKGIGEILFDKLNENKDLIMQIDGLSGEKDTYGQFLQKSIRTALKMYKKGITSQDFVTVCSHNHLNTNVPIVASFLLGIKTASIDPGLSLSDSVYLLNIVRPKIIFASSDCLVLMEDMIRETGLKAEIVVFGKSVKYTQFSEFLDKPKEEDHFLPVQTKDLKEIALMAFSSGTTGLAKAICLTHLSLISQLCMISDSISKREFETITQFTTLNYSSPYWLSSLFMLENTIITNGCRLVLPKFDTASFWYYIEKYKVQFVLLSPTQLAMLSNSKKPHTINTVNLKVIYVCGSTVYKDQIDKINEMIPTAVVTVGYGQSEVGGICFQHNVNSDDLLYLVGKPTSCGRPKPGYSYKIVDLETEQSLGPNKNGELRVKAYSCMSGYYGIDSSNVWDSNGFLKTGDILYYDDSYCFYVVDRLKDMIKYQGWQISPAKLETILLSHPGVDAALVIGLPHIEDVDHPMGIVRLKKSASNITATEINKYYEENIDDERYKLRGGLRIVSEIPVTPSGKYKKFYLKHLILQGRL